MIKTLEPAPKAPAAEPAVALPSRWRRLGATIIDAALLAPVAFTITLVSGLLESAEAYVSWQPYARISLIVIAAYLLINGVLLHRHGQTVGKRLLNMRIVTAKTGTRPPLWRLLVRGFTFPALLFVPVAILVCFFDPFLIFGRTRRCLHDFLVGTIVHPVSAGETPSSVVA